MYAPIIVLENEYLKVSIKKLGAELCSFYSKELDKEILWQADPQYWGRHAPLLFPIVGKVKESTSALKQHGLARDEQFMVLTEEQFEVLFRLQSSIDTKKVYPYDFALDVNYKLIERSLITKLTVKNTGLVDLPFSLGLHPGFNIQKNSRLVIENLPTQAFSLTNGFLSAVPILSPFTKNEMILNEDTFKQDALIFKNISPQKINLVNTEYNIEMSNGSAPYLAFWNKPGSSFVCIEPWYGVPDGENFSGTLNEKEGIINLSPEKIFSDNFEIKFSKHSC